LNGRGHRLTPSGERRYQAGAGCSARRPATPKALAVTVTFFATLLAGALSIKGDARFVIVPLIASVPLLLIERVYNVRRRRAQEQLLPTAGRS
jgi:hypothetical protein